MTDFYRIGYSMRTHHVKSWTSPNVGRASDVIALARPGFSRERMAGALRRMADAIEEMPDPNRAETSLPAAHYTVGEPDEVAPLPKTRRNVAALG